MVDIRLDRLRKDFPDGTTAVHDFSLAIEHGEFLTFLGPSGCGKTTTLRMVAGLETPSAGDIWFGARRVNELAPGERNIAMVFQSYALYPHMTVRENLEYPLRKRGVPREERAKRVQDTAALLEIDALLARRPKQLSGGQQQRVALGRALVREPDVFLLDEPLSNLDAELRAHMRAELIQLHRRLGRTTIYVTHDQIEAMTMSTRIAVMHRGRLQQVGTPQEIYDAPINRTVASFVGSPAMNFIPGTVVAENGRPIFRATAAAVSLQLGEGSMPPGPVVLGVRPEDILVGSGPIDMEVLVAERTGAETILTMRLGEGQIVARIAADMKVRAGERVAAGLRPAKSHFFDAEDGQRLALFQ